MASIFSKIIAREIPADIVYEDESVIAFLDIAPVNKGHTLVVPKKEYRWFYDVPAELAGELFVVSQKISRALKHATGADFIQLSIVGDEVPHVHIHLIPRFANDGLGGWRKNSYEKDEARTYANNIRDALSSASER
jgi:histidine triad (HIT) family protein